PEMRPKVGYEKHAQEKGAGSSEHAHTKQNRFSQLPDNEWPDDVELLLDGEAPEMAHNTRPVKARHFRRNPVLQIKKVGSAMPAFRRHHGIQPVGEATRRKEQEDGQVINGKNTQEA